MALALGLKALTRPVKACGAVRSRSVKVRANVRAPARSSSSPASPASSVVVSARRSSVVMMAAKKAPPPGMVSFTTYLSTAPVVTFAFLIFMSGLIIEVNRYFPDPLTMTGLLVK
eukprot:CAMPEP_0119195036 /NCGR_PEP_ID=MMETSP1316-20130426/4680_1 /TAXON_ID=41880 /ORGANISM="Pycnococcus provasolii, Strain RCC2336" /LENGTH=114 /DNA_ID=CAMNT_0007190413 /DNA_START=9 /DNA_END=353 /DNA_ORIENTATION=+